MANTILIVWCDYIISFVGEGKEGLGEGLGEGQGKGKRGRGSMEERGEEITFLCGSR